MRLPTYLANAIDHLIAQDRGRTAAASAALTRRYKAGDFSSPAVRAQADRDAYLAARFPATFAAATHVFLELRRLAPQVQIASLLDLGAGPGTALLAAAEVFAELRTASLIEADSEWLRLGRQLTEQSPLAAVREAQWIQRDLQPVDELPLHDMIVISYALGELAGPVRRTLTAMAWSAAGNFLVIIEPGTTRGFAHINEARNTMIAAGAEILAPCPHKNVCPMAEAGDWCHFAQRLQRTAEHRLAKGGSLSYEDEKFSYVIASRQSLRSAEARIVRHPRKHSGHVQLELCAHEGLVRKTVTRSQKGLYRRSRQVDWGDEWNP